MTPLRCLFLPSNRTLSSILALLIKPLVVLFSSSTTSAPLSGDKRSAGRRQGKRGRHG
nr:MAG TPA_asm: hypothetical protein [Caudoviricetes sp.]